MSIAVGGESRCAGALGSGLLHFGGETGARKKDASQHGGELYLTINQYPSGTLRRGKEREGEGLRGEGMGGGEGVVGSG